MLVRRIVQRKWLQPCVRSKRWSSGTPSTEVQPSEAVIAGGCVGGIIGASYGSYQGYMLHRHKSYYDCVVQTTSSCMVGTGTGIFLGCYSVFIGSVVIFLSPILVPILGICVPVAGGTVLVKYFDKHATTNEQNYTNYIDK